MFYSNVFKLQTFSLHYVSNLQLWFSGEEIFSAKQCFFARDYRKPKQYIRDVQNLNREIRNVRRQRAVSLR